jgi:hypothetical protein
MVFIPVEFVIFNVMKIILYTHTDVNWVYPIWFKQMNLFMGDFEKIVFINDPIDIDTKKMETYLYDDKLVYKDRVFNCLLNMDDDEVVLFNHEDMFLYSAPDYEKLYEMETLIKSNSVDLIKLLRNGDNLTSYNNFEYLYHNYDGFSIQPTIVKVKTLKEIFYKIEGNTIWNFENNSMNVVNKWGLTNLFIYDNKPKRGSNHWDSGIYPYVATAVVKGNWNDEYSNELKLIKNI